MPLRTKLFNMVPWVGGVNTSIDESMIPANDLTIANNITFDTRGSRKRRQAINFDFDDASSGTDLVIGLHDFHFGSIGGKTQRLVSVFDSKEIFSYELDGTRSVDRFGGEAWGVDIDTVSMEVINNRCIIAVDGSTNCIKSWDGVEATVEDLGSKQETEITTVADIAASLDGTYFILADSAGTVAFWIDVDNSGTAEPAHGADRAVEITTITTGDTAIAVAVAVKAAVDGDSEFDATVEAGTDLVLAIAATIGTRDNSTAGTSGFTVLNIRFGDTAPKGSILRNHLGRLWTNDKAEPDRLHYSQTGDPEIWNGFGDSGAIDIGLGDGDPEGITAIFPSFKGVLFVAKRTKLYKISGFTPETFQVELISNGIGCVSHNALAPVDQDDVFFISERGIHSLAATDQFGDFSSAFLSQSIQKTFNDNFVFSRLKFSWGAYLPEINSVGFAVTDENYSSSINKAIWLYNIPLKSWYTWTNITAQSLITVNDNDKKRFYLGTNTGRIAKTQISGNGDLDELGADKAIDMFVKTGRMFPDDNSYSIKGFKKLAIIYKPKGTHTLTVTTKIDNFGVQANAFTNVGGEDLLGSTFLLGSSELGSAIAVSPFARSIDGFGRGVQLTFRQCAVETGVEIQGFAIEYEPAGTQQEVRTSDTGSA